MRDAEASAAWFSPRRRRWSAGQDLVAQVPEVPSAQAEVVRTGLRTRPDSRRSLRAGGGGPNYIRTALYMAVFSPRRRRWSRAHAAQVGQDPVLSAQAEVVRCWSRCRRCSWCSLRAGGGGPSPRSSRTLAGWFSPCRRRWSGRVRRRPPQPRVLSAQAEVVRSNRCCGCTASGSLRAGGGGPSKGSAPATSTRFSPRRRRWSVLAVVASGHYLVLSAQAEVVRPAPAPPCPWPCSLRAGGDGPRPGCRAERYIRFSPRRRRWSARPAGVHRDAGVLSAQAEVVLKDLARELPQPRSLRAGGGGPTLSTVVDLLTEFSPRRRRWFDPIPRLTKRVLVLSAQVEVVLQHKGCRGP